MPELDIEAIKKHLWAGHRLNEKDTLAIIDRLEALEKLREVAARRERQYNIFVELIHNIVEEPVT